MYAKPRNILSAACRTCFIRSGMSRFCGYPPDSSGMYDIIMRKKPNHVKKKRDHFHNSRPEHRTPPASYAGKAFPYLRVRIVVGRRRKADRISDLAGLLSI